MSFSQKFKKLLLLIKCFQYQRRLGWDLINSLPNILRGFDYAQQWQSDGMAVTTVPFSHEYRITDTPPNPLKVFFDTHETGRGIWKWEHYFDIYHRHFSKFVGRDVHVLEIGVYSGGSLEMWRNYFGPKSHIYGVDIQEECKCYNNEYTRILIGDQADPEFWRYFKRNVPVLDILIDDGGHQTEQQIVTFEEMLPHLRPGGVYLCEDTHGIHNSFPAFMYGIANNLNAAEHNKSTPGFIPTDFQTWIHSVHFYPYVTVIEKNYSPLKQLIDSKHGSEWQPFP